MRMFLVKRKLYKFWILLIVISSLILLTNRVIGIKKDISEDKKTGEIISNNKSADNDYFAVLEIPKIKFKKGLVGVDSKNNDVDKNIEILSWDIDKNLIVLAAHSGSGYKAYFKNLYKLEIGDISNIYYNNQIYNYLVIDIYKEVKDGDIEIPNCSNCLIFTTCYGKDEQLIVILKEKEF